MWDRKVFKDYEPIRGKNGEMLIGETEMMVTRERESNKAEVITGPWGVI